MNNLDKIEVYAAQMKNLYLKGDEKQKESIMRILDAIFSGNSIDSNINKMDLITNLPNKESLIQDISSLKEDAMLIVLHVNQISVVQQLYGFDVVENIIIDKADTLKHLVRETEATLYSLDLQKFAILVSNKLLFDKYISILHFSIFNNIDSDTYKSATGEKIISDFTAGISYGLSCLHYTANVALQEAMLSKLTYKIYDRGPECIGLKQSSLDKFQVYKSALHEGQIIPYFQPIIDAKDGSVVKYEALARLQLADGTIVSPYDFLNAAIEDRSFEFFTRQMMQKVFNVYSKSDIEISMNLTYTNLKSKSTLDYIQNRLDKYGGEGITFEIVETEEIGDYKVVEDFILMVKTYGCKISIDDFGSGYSSFTNLIKLNIDFIKIDGTLTTKLLIDEKAKTMVQGLIHFAKNINIKTIAEFVSSKELSDCTKELGVDYLQGYYHGEPKSAESYGLA